jgi:hypothetical protein
MTSFNQLKARAGMIAVRGQDPPEVKRLAQIVYELCQECEDKESQTDRIRRDVEHLTRISHEAD